MNLKKIALACLFSLSICPALALAEISIFNNTNGTGAAKTDASPCSSVVEDGVIKPHSTLPVPQWIADLYCGFGCDIEIHMTKDCSSKPIAIISVDFFQNVSGVRNNNVNGYRVTRTGQQSARIDGGP